MSEGIILSPQVKSGSAFLSITAENHIWDSDRFNDTQANVQVV